jgi:hypothetical protein
MLVHKKRQHKYTGIARRSQEYLNSIMNRMMNKLSCDIVVDAGAVTRKGRAFIGAIVLSYDAC